MLKVSGDVDLAVPITGTLNWINSLNQTILDEYRPYMVGEDVGGFTQKYEGLTFASVLGAGHMVPKDKPEVAYYLIKKWLNNEPF